MADKKPWRVQMGPLAREQIAEIMDRHPEAGEAIDKMMKQLLEATEAWEAGRYATLDEAMAALCPTAKKLTPEEMDKLDAEVEEQMASRCLSNAVKCH